MTWKQVRNDLELNSTCLTPETSLNDVDRVLPKTSIPESYSKIFKHCWLRTSKSFSRNSNDRGVCFVCFVQLVQVQYIASLPAGIEGFHEGFLPSSNSSTWSGKSALALLLSFFGKFSTSTYKYQGIQHNAGRCPIQFGIHRGPYRASPARRRPKTSRLDPDGRLRLSTLSTVETVAPWHIQTSPIWRLPHLEPFHAPVS